VLGVALFGSLVAQAGAFMAGMRLSLLISSAALLAAAGAIRSRAPQRAATAGL
jgi:DHA2 family methylenomycin A resistance protein-like MFS transporter